MKELCPLFIPSIWKASFPVLTLRRDPLTYADIAGLIGYRLYSASNESASPSPARRKEAASSRRHGDAPLSPPSARTGDCLLKKVLEQTQKPETFAVSGQCVQRTAGYTVRCHFPRAFGQVFHTGAPVPPVLRGGRSFRPADTASHPRQRRWQSWR